MTKVYGVNCILSDGMEADVLISARIRVEKVDERGEIALVCFTDISELHHKVAPEEATCWISAHSVREAKPVMARVALYAGQWEMIRELVDKARKERGHERTDDRQIIQAIDDAIGPEWLKKRQEQPK